MKNCKKTTQLYTKTTGLNTTNVNNQRYCINMYKRLIEIELFQENPSHEQLLDLPKLNWNNYLRLIENPFCPRRNPTTKVFNLSGKKQYIYIYIYGQRAPTPCVNGTKRLRSDMFDGIRYWHGNVYLMSRGLKCYQIRSWKV